MTRNEEGGVLRTEDTKGHREMGRFGLPAFALIVVLVSGFSEQAVIADYTIEPHSETRGFNGKLSGKHDGTTMEPL